MLIIDTNTINVIMLVIVLVTATCSIRSLYTSIQNKNNLQNLILSLEMRMSQLIAMSEKKANAEGQMQGRDWATKQTNDAALAVVNQAANTAAELLQSAAITATQLKGNN